MNNNEMHTVRIENKTARVALSVTIGVIAALVSHKCLEGEMTFPTGAIHKMIDGAKDILEANKAIETAADIK